MYEQWRLDTPSPTALGDLQTVLEAERDHFLKTSSVTKRYETVKKTDAQGVDQDCVEEHDDPRFGDKTDAIVATTKTILDHGIATALQMAPMPSQNGTVKLHVSIYGFLYPDGRRSFTVSIDQVLPQLASP